MEISKSPLPVFFLSSTGNRGVAAAAPCRRFPAAVWHLRRPWLTTRPSWPSLGPTPLLCWLFILSPRRAAKPAPVFFLSDEPPPREAALSSLLALHCLYASHVEHRHHPNRPLLVPLACATPPERLPCVTHRRPPWEKRRRHQFCHLLGQACPLDPSLTYPVVFGLYIPLTEPHRRPTSHRTLSFSGELDSAARVLTATW